MHKVGRRQGEASEGQNYKEGGERWEENLTRGRVNAEFACFGRSKISVPKFGHLS